MVLHLINDTIKGGVVEDGKLLLTNNWEMLRKTGTWISAFAVAGSSPSLMLLTHWLAKRDLWTQSKGKVNFMHCDPFTTWSFYCLLDVERNTDCILNVCMVPHNVLCPAAVLSDAYSVLSKADLTAISRSYTHSHPVANVSAVLNFLSLQLRFSTLSSCSPDNRAIFIIETIQRAPILSFYYQVKLFFFCKQFYGLIIKYFAVWKWHLL